MIDIEMPDTRVAIQFASGNLIDQVDVAVSRDRAESAKSTPVERIAVRNGRRNLAALDFGKGIYLSLVRLTDVESASNDGDHGGADRAPDRGQAPVTGILGTGTDTGSSAGSGPIGGCSPRSLLWGSRGVACRPAEPTTRPADGIRSMSEDAPFGVPHTESG